MSTKEMIEPSIYRNLPTVVKTSLEKLSDQKKAEFVEEYRRKKKSMGVAYVCWFLLGWHYIYFHKWGMQLLFWLTGGGFLIWWFIDLFRIPGITRGYNQDVAIATLRDIKLLSS
jgi:hypothetical protein